MIQIQIANQKVEKNQLQQWEASCLKDSCSYLKQETINTSQGLTAYKVGLGEESLRQTLARDLRISNFCTRIGILLSGKRRKYSQVLIDLDFCSAETFQNFCEDIMLRNSPQNTWNNLAAHPHHYLLKALDPHKQEVIEKAGGSPLPLHFILQYNDQSGLTSSANPDYPIQITATAYLPQGLVIGGARHQVKNTSKGCQILLTIEFPGMLTNSMIHQHEQHLAVEFYNWCRQLEKALKKEASS